MKIAFRTDASAEIASGHFMRCVTLADELKKKGAKIRFLSKNLPLHLIKILKQKGFEYVALNICANIEEIDDLAHSSWLGTSQAQDARATIEALADQRLWDWVIVDHYALDGRWETMVHARTKRLMVIDDLADRQHNCEILLDQNFYLDMQSRYIGKIPTQCRLLSGPRYSLLREEFRTLREEVKPHLGDIKRVLVFFGGVDGDDYTSLAIEALAELNSELIVDVVIGIQHPNREKIKNACFKYDYNLHIQTKYIGYLMAEADLAIGAGGSSSWERCCLGLPSLLVALAEHQIDIAKSLDYIGGCIYLGTKNAINSTSIKQAIIRLLDNPGRTAALSRQAFSITDGFGAYRVSQELSY